MFLNNFFLYILVVHSCQINAFPPVRNLIEILLRNNHNITVITRDDSGVYLKENPNLKYIVLPEGATGKITAGLAYIKKLKILRETVEKEMENCDLLWTTTDSTVRDLGKLVFKYKHVMQMMELIEDIPLIPGLPYIQSNLKQYAKKAYKVVVPEYNRAHIQKTWWDLEKVPSVLPNKMTMPEIDAVPEDIQKIILEIKNEKRKILLYQGVFLSDRDLDLYAQTAEKLKDEYCLYIMGRDMPYRRELCDKYPHIKYIPFIKPPFHLLVTQLAYVGLLPYKAAKSQHYSILNALYCAPNKIYEYAACGLPMIGSDVPGLTYPFSVNDIGYICKEKKVEEVIKIIRLIENRYDELVSNCLKFYDKTDMDNIVEEILR